RISLQHREDLVNEGLQSVDGQAATRPGGFSFPRIPLPEKVEMVDLGPVVILAADDKHGQYVGIGMRCRQLCSQPDRAGDLVDVVEGASEQRGLMCGRDREGLRRSKLCRMLRQRNTSHL